MIVMENHYDGTVALRLQILGVGLVQILEIASGGKIHIIFKKGIGTPIIQNVFELCKKEIIEKREGNTIIPLEEFTLFVHYAQNKEDIIVLLYMSEKSYVMNFPKLYILTKKIFNSFHSNVPISEIIKTCDDAIEIPHVEGVIGIFILGASGCPYISKIQKDRKLISQSEVHIGGFISALFSFSQEIIGGESGAELKEIDFGNQHFYMIKKNKVIFAFLVEEMNSIIQSYMYLLADEFFDQFKEHISKFDGDVSRFYEFEKTINKYFKI